VKPSRMGKIYNLKNQTTCAGSLLRRQLEGCEVLFRN
jgi:hypothetical protein